MNRSATPASLLSIIAQARSGAVEHAWRLFREGGYDQVTDDPAVLSVRGRLLKDNGRATTGEARRRWYRQAAEAYGRAGEISGATYPLINAASLSLLAGDAAGAQAQARRVLARGSDPDETAYYQSATRAEALLLLGRIGEAKAAMAEAMAAAPKAWEDHASTLRQFALILAELGESADWLDALRPPRALNFGGHMDVDGGAVIEEEIRQVLHEQRVGFGFGALAAGADIIVAEALLTAGAELHLLLPADMDVFREASVVTRGANWARRFDDIIDKADTVRTVGCPRLSLSMADLRLASEVAMGEAVLHARALATEALQLLIVDSADAPVGDPGGTGWAREVWRTAGRRQRIIVAPRAATPLRAAGRLDGGTIAAVLLVELAADGDQFAPVLSPELLARLKNAVDDAPPPMFAPSWSGARLSLAYPTASEAAAAALQVQGALAAGAPRIAGAYGLVDLVEDPFGGPTLLMGEVAALPARILPGMPAGSVQLTEDFVSALAATQDEPHCEYAGELTRPSLDPVRLFSLKRNGSEDHLFEPVGS